MMCVVFTPAMSAATADTRLSSSYQPRSIGSRDNANAATAVRISSSGISPSSQAGSRPAPASSSRVAARACERCRHR